MKLNSAELNKLLEQVSDDVAAVLAKAEESEKTLAKASPGEEAPGEETPSGSSAEGSQPEGSPEASPSEGPEGSAGDAGEPAPEGQEAGEAPAPGDEQTQNPAEDESSGPEALVAEYSKLPVEELKMHVMAAHAALMQMIGGPGEGPEAGGEQAPEGVSPEGTQPAGTEQPPMGKKEIKSEGSGGKIMKSEKSDLEVRLDTLEKSLKVEADKNKELETKLVEATDGLRKFVEKSGNQAMRKSVASISFTGKPGDRTDKEVVVLSKSEATKKLNALTADHEKMGKLEKSDREKISQYILGIVPQTEISHLLK